MAQVHVNHLEVQQFLLALQMFQESVSGATQSLTADFEKLGDAWQDEKRRPFESDFNLLKSQLIHFNDSAEVLSTYLRAIAQHIENYQNL